MSEGVPPNRLPSGKAGRALVVDDDPVCRRFCTHVLSAHGWSTREAGTASAALRRMSARLPDLILVDCRLPDPAARRRLLDQCAAIGDRDRPVVLAMSAGPPAAEAGRSPSEPGYDHFLHKPFAAGDLLAAVAATGMNRRSGDATTPSGGGPEPEREHEAPAFAPHDDPSGVLAERFLHELPKDLDRLDRALAERSWLQARHTLHQLRGAAAISGHGAIAENCRRLHHCLERCPPSPGWGALYTALLDDGAAACAAGGTVRRRE